MFALKFLIKNRQCFNTSLFNIRLTKIYNRIPENFKFSQLEIKVDSSNKKNSHP